ncbi:hypothetical protein AB0M95_27605 [Sphaerisporangium sp. NPDC051017]|uniref:hypothetical protein n=1 Tax=Sphaerisporangium sp. NPDC051017 TaxID=3154636 RepID=UPI003448BBBE
MSGLEIYRRRVKELRAKGVGSVAAHRIAMDEARRRIDQREQAWHDAQEAAAAGRTEVTR